MHYNKFPNLGVYHANFPNLKSPSQNSKKIPEGPDKLFALKSKLFGHKILLRYYLSVETCILGAQKNEMVLLSTHNICFWLKK